jgi:hypothetical protein
MSHLAFLEISLFFTLINLATLCLGYQVFNLTCRLFKLNENSLDKITSLGLWGLIGIGSLGFYGLILGLMGIFNYQSLFIGIFLTFLSWIIFFKKEV